MHIVLILCDIRSSHNVGSIFRTADAVGVEKIYLVGYTPAPIDRFGRSVGEITKTALGAENSVSWEKISSAEKIIDFLKKDNFEIVALEQSPKAIDHRKYKGPSKVALIVGNEVGGVEGHILSLCDKIIEIPMRGQKESLNVSVATAVALFEIIK